jgi:hypothetical protein
MATGNDHQAAIAVELGNSGLCGGSEIVARRFNSLSK